MAEKIKFTRAFWQEWQRNPQQTAEKYGFNWNELDTEWKGQDWQNMSFDDFEKLWKKSRFAGFVDFT